MDLCGKVVINGYYYDMLQLPEHTSLVTLPNMLDSGYNLNKTVFLGNDKLV